MLLECLPVLPPDLRPMREIPGSKARFSSDLNLFYENILRVGLNYQFGGPVVAKY